MMRQYEWFKFDPTDFLADIGCMDNDQIAVYIQLLCRLWMSGGTLPENVAVLGRLIPDVERVWPSIEHRFVRVDTGWAHVRMDALRADIHRRSTKAQVGAQARWERERAKYAQGTTGGAHANALRSECDRMPNALLRASCSSSPSSPSVLTKSFQKSERQEVALKQDAGDGGERQESAAVFLAECGVSPRSRPGKLALAMLERAESDAPGLISSMRAKFGDRDAAGGWTLDAMYRKTRSRGLLLTEMCAACGESADAMGGQESKIRAQISAFRSRK